jgi:pilus assembly protein CpaC
MIRLAIRLSALLLALAPIGALAPVPADAAPKVVTSSGAPLMVEVGKGELVHLDSAVNTVFVANPDIADVQVKSPTLIYLFGKAGGETTLFAVGEDDRVVLNMDVRVRYNVARLQDAIHKAAPRAAVSVNSLDDAVVLEGTVYSVAEGDDIRRVAERLLPNANQLVNKMKVDAPNQIQLRVRIAEVDRTVIKELGINWETMFGAGNFAIGLATGTTVLNGGAGPFSAAEAAAGKFFGTNSFATRAPVPGGTSGDLANSIGVGFNSGRTNLDAIIDALDKTGLATVLAQPNLTAASGESASFLAGGEFPVPIPQAGTAGTIPTISIEWKKFGVGLNFVATISANNRINIHVMPEVSQLSTLGAIAIDGISVPSLTVRRAETTVDVASGQSFAIAGLLQNNVNQTISKFPWLGDVPVLGALFRSDTFQRNESELVIIVTPYIVRPVATANALQAPTDGYTSSTDKDLLVDGAEYKPQVVKHGAAPVGRSGSGLIGPIGFELE